MAAPIASSFATLVPKDRQTPITLQGSDADLTTLVYAIVGSPSHGTLSLDTATGIVIYMPNAGYEGADSFTYHVTSGGDTSSTGTVSLTVTAAKTRVIDRVTDPSGAPLSGIVSFFLTQPATSPGGLVVRGASISAVLDGDGRFDVSLYPSAGLDPRALYQVWHAPRSGGQTYVGMADIPYSSVTINLTPHLVVDANLAARYKFASEAALMAMTGAISEATLASLTSENVTGALTFTPENVANKSTDVEADAASDTKYPSVKAVKTYVDAHAGDATSNSLLNDLSNYWKLEEGGSTPRADSAGSSPLTPSAGLAAVSTVAGKIGLCQPLYSPENRYLYAADSAELSTGDISFTISVWIYLDSAGQVSSNPGLVTKWGAVDANREYMLLYDTTGALGGTANRFVFAVMAGTTKTQLVAGFAPSTDTWYHVVAWRDKTASTINVQVNGGTIYSTAQSGAINDGAAQLQIGAINAADALTGRIDEVSIWKRALTLSERAQLYNSGNGLQYDFVDTSAIVSRTYSYSIQIDFHASGSDEQTTGSISATSHALTVADAKDFAPHHGILIAGAGTAGADFVTTIESIAGNVLTLTDAAITTVAGALVMHDDTKAIQDSLDRVAGDGGGRVEWEDGIYNINRALNSTTHSQLYYPWNAIGNTPYTVHWHGRFVSRTSESALPTEGVILKTQRVGSAGAGTFSSMIAAGAWTDTGTGGLASFNYCFPVVENFAVITATNPQLTIWNFNNAIGVLIDNPQQFAGTVYASTVEPTNTESAFIRLSGNNNHAQVRLSNASGFGMYTGVVFSEHAVIDGFTFSKAKQGMVRAAGLHSALILKAQTESCRRHFVVESGSGITHALVFGMEIDSGGTWHAAAANEWLYDSGNIARGRMYCTFTTGGGGVGSGLPQYTGFQFAKLIDLYSGDEKPVGTP
jgi:hypothetical protein